MARILYGVAGEGMGHAVRSKSILEELTKKHNVKVVSSGNAYTYLSKFFDVSKIGYFKIIYRNNKAANFLTFLNNFFVFPVIISKSWKIKKIIKEFKPGIIITDFEPFVVYFSLFKKIPVISIDNQHLIRKIKLYKLKKKYVVYRLITKIIILLFIIKANKYFITSFYNLKSYGEKFIIIKPILRKEIINAKHKKGKHILVYQTSKSNKNLITALTNVNENFIVYGFKEKKKIKNVVLKENDEKEFIKDLVSSKAVITNGGFTLITEALYLNKPILSIPVKKHFEQIFNALLIHKLNFGFFSEDSNKEVIDEFIKKIPHIRNIQKKYKKYNNNSAFRQINEAVNSLIAEFNR